jgi:putative ABC transport system permease protein
MPDLIAEVRYAWRAVTKAPGFSLTVIATLAIGLGATVAIFTVVNGLLLRPLPYPDPDRLVMVWQDLTRRDGPDREWFTPPDFIDLRDETTSFAAVAAVGGWGPAMTTAEGAEALEGAVVSSGWFDAVGVRPVLGAPFGADTELPGAPPVVVLSHDLWQRRFGADPGVIGSTVRLNDVPHEVVGVMPAGFRDPLFPAEIWRSRVLDPTNCGRGCYTLRVLGRLGPGATLQSANADANVLAGRLAAEHAPNRDVGFNVVGLKQDVTAEARPALLALGVAVMLLLLIAVVNVANLLVARAGVRERELAIRGAIGAGRGAIIRQILVETTVLAAIGAVAAAVIAVWAVDVLVALAPEGTPRLDEVAVDGSSVLFAAVAGLLAGLAAALGPAWQATRGSLAEVMKESGGHRASVGRRRVRSGLIVAEVAIALTLLIGSGLTLRSLARLQQVDPGFDAAGLVTGAYFLPAARYPAGDPVRAFVDEAVERIAALPGVAGVATTSILPMTEGDNDFGFEIVGRVVGPDEQGAASWFRRVSPSYFDVMGMRIIEGRGFTADDRAGDGATWAVVVNEQFVRRHFPGERAVGARLHFGQGQMAEIVGVLADVRHRGLGTEPIVELFMSTAQTPSRSFNIVARTGLGSAATGAAIRDVMRGLDRALPPPAFRAMDELVAQSIALPRLYSAFFAFFATVAVLLAGVGVYGLTAYTVGQRRQEIGIRVALGARAADVVRMVVQHAMLLTAAGLGIGLIAAFALARPLAVLLFEMGPYDVATFVGVPALLAAIALLASWLPARRAAQVDPLTALRPE